MKTKRRIRTLEELWAIEDEFPLAFAPDPVHLALKWVAAVKELPQASPGTRSQRQRQSGFNSFPPQSRNGVT